MLKLALMAGLTNKRITIPKLSAIVSLAVSRAVTLGPFLLKISFTLNLTDALWHFRFRCCVCCCQLKNCFQLSCFSTAWKKMKRKTLKHQSNQKLCVSSSSCPYQKFVSLSFLITENDCKALASYSNKVCAEIDYWKIFSSGWDFS